MWKLFNVFFAP